MLDKTVIERIKKEISMVDLASLYTDLERSSSNIWQGSCPHPNHQDSDPSFTVWEQSNTWACMGCHSGKKDNQTNFGTDQIAFVQWVEEVNFKKAVEMLAAEFGIPLPDHPHQKELDKRYRKALYYHQNLNDEALNYLYERGITDDSIKTFLIGYDGERIVFPLMDRSKSVLGFTKRVIDESKPKYKNSPGDHIFNKSQYLYGLHLLSQESPYIYITEGPTDVIGAYQHGLKNVVGVLSNNLSEQQTELIDQTNKIPVMAFDGGEKNEVKQLKAASLLSEKGFNPYLLKLPPEKDLADIAEFMQERFLSYVENNTKEYSLSVVGDLVNQFELEVQALKLKYMPKLQKAYDRIPDHLNQKEMIHHYITEKTGINPKWGKNLHDDMFKL